MIGSVEGGLLVMDGQLIGSKGRHKSCGEVTSPSLKPGEAYLSAENTWCSSKKSFSNCSCLVKSSSKAKEISEIHIVYIPWIWRAPAKWA